MLDDCMGPPCKSIDDSLPIYCPACLSKHFYRLTEEDLAEMYIFFAEDDNTPEELKELFFEAFNGLMMIKRKQLEPFE